MLPVCSRPAPLSPSLHTPTLALAFQFLPFSLHSKLPKHPCIRMPLHAHACPPPPSSSNRSQVSLAGACSAVAMPSISPLILDWTSDAERAKALAMRQMAQDSGALCGAAGMGVVATACGVQTAMVLTAAMQAAATLFFAVRAPSHVPTGEALAKLR
eukprot:6202675-Pleurochrysis_carterae.AAC.3